VRCIDKTMNTRCNNSKYANCTRIKINTLLIHHIKYVIKSKMIIVYHYINTKSSPVLYCTTWADHKMCINPWMTMSVLKISPTLKVRSGRYMFIEINMISLHLSLRYSFQLLDIWYEHYVNCNMCKLYYYRSTRVLSRSAHILSKTHQYQLPSMYYCLLGRFIIIIIIYLSRLHAPIACEWQATACHSQDVIA